MNNTNFQTIILVVFGFAIILGVLLFSGVLPGFRSTDGAAGGKLTVWGTLSLEDLTPFLSTFNQKYKSQFTLQYVEKSPDSFEADLVDAIASGNAPDLVFFPAEFIVKHANKFTSFTTAEVSVRDFKNNYVTGAEIFQTEAGAIGLPVLVDPLVLYWNRDLFAAAGVSEPPKVWSEVVKGSEGMLGKLTLFDSKNAIIQSALPLGDPANVRHSKDILVTLMMQAGSPLVVQNNGYKAALVSNEIGVSSPAQAALDFFIQFADPAKTTYTWNRSFPDSLEAFSGGLSTMYLGFASEWKQIRDKAPLINFDVASMPQRDRSRQAAFAEVLALAVPKSSAKAAAAKTAALTIANGTLAWDLAGAANLPPARRDLLARSNKDPFLATFYQAAQVGKAWYDPDTTKTEELFYTMAESVLTGRVKSSEAVNRAQEELGLIITNK